MSHRPSFTARRRRQLALRTAALERLEGRSLISDSLLSFTLGLGAPVALAGLGAVEAGSASGLAARQRRMPRGVDGEAMTPPVLVEVPPGAAQPGARDRSDGPAAAPLRLVASPARSGDWLDIAAAGDMDPPRPATASGADAPAGEAGGAPAAGGAGGAGGTGRSRGAITPLRVPPPQAPGMALDTSGTSTPGPAGIAPRATPAETSAAVAAPGAGDATTTEAEDSGTSGVLGDSGGSGGGNALVSISDPATDAWASETPASTQPYTPDTGLFTVSRTGGDFSSSLTVNFSVGGTATEGSDYQTLSRSVTILAGQGSATIEVVAIDDEVAGEGSETVDVTLQPGTGYTVYTPDTSTVRIADNDVDAPPVDGITTTDDNAGDADPDGPFDPDCGCEVLVDPFRGAVHLHSGGNGQVDCTAPGPEYSSLTNPHPVVSVEWTLPAEPGTSPAAPPPTVVAEATMAGVTAGPVYYRTDGYGVGDRVRIALEIDASTLPAGRHAYTITLKTLDGSGAVIAAQTETFDGQATVFNRTDTGGTMTISYGVGWWMSTLDRLIAGAGGVALVRANATAGWFAAGASSTYVSPDGRKRTVLSGTPGGWALQHPDGGTSIFDGNGLLQWRTDRNGNTTTYTYTDADGDLLADELATVTDPFGRVASYAYSNGGRLQTRTDFFGRVTTYTYDVAGRIQTVIQADPDGAGPGQSPVTTYTYDPATGQMRTVTNPEGDVTTFTYENRRVRSVEHPGRGAAEQIVPVTSAGLAAPGTGTGTLANPAPLAPASGWRATITDATDRTTTIDYDRLGNPVRIIDPLQDVTRYERNANGQVTRHIAPDPDGPDGPLWPSITDYRYDGRHNLIGMTLPDGRTRSWTYHPTRSWVTSFTDEDNRTTTYTLDEDNGNRETAVDALMRTTTFTYGSVVGALGAVDGLLTAVTRPDPDGTAAGQGPTTTTYAYDGLGRLATITHPGGDEVTLAYDADENLEAITDELGRTTTYTYDALGRQTGVLLPDPDNPAASVTTPTWTTAYRRDGRVGSVTDLLGRTTTYTYDGGRLTAVTLPDPDGIGAQAPTTYTYDAADRLRTVTDPLGRVTTYAYDGAGRLEAITLPDPDGSGGQDPTTSYTYDNRGRVTAVEDPLGRVTAYAYDDRDRLVTRTGPDPDGPGGQEPPVTTYGYTAVGRLHTLTGPDPGGPGGQEAPTTTYAYDALHRLAAVTGPDPDGPGGEAPPTTTYTYDRLDRLTTVEDALGRVTTYAYDLRDRLVSETRPATATQAAATTVYGYTAVGRLETVTGPDPDGVGGQDAPTTTYAYDRRDRLVTVTRPAVDAVEPVTTYTYDPFDQLATVTDPEGHTTTYGRDVLGRLTTVTDPGLGQTVTTYDDVGNVVAVTDPEGHTTTYAYDALDRVTTMTDPRGQVATSAYDAAGQLVEATDRLGRRTAYAYDGLGRLTTERWLDAAGGTIRTVTSTYDGLDRLVAIADPDATLDFAYDGLGRPISAGTEGAAPGQPDVTLEAAYDAVGNRTRLADDLAGPGVGVTTYAYDARDRLTTITRSLGGVAGPQVALAYDARDRLTGLTRTAGAGSAAVTTTFAYDVLDRLTTLTHQVLGGATLASYAYGYDQAGRLVRETNAEGTATYTYDDLGQLTGVDRPVGQADEAYDYDANGNRDAPGHAVGSGNRLVAAPGATATNVVSTVFDADGGYQAPLRNGPVPIVPGPDGNARQFDYADANADGIADLIYTTKQNTGTGTIEVHVLDGASDYQNWIVHAPTPLGTVYADDIFQFDYADVDGDGQADLILTITQATGTGTIEAHVLSAASGYQSWILHTGTPHGIATGDDSREFAYADYDGDGIADLINTSRYGTASGTVEVHVLDGATGYQTWLLNTATPHGSTTGDDSREFAYADVNADGKADLINTSRYGTASGTVEVHILDGATGYQIGLLSTATPIGLAPSAAVTPPGLAPADDVWQFDYADTDADGKAELIRTAKYGHGTAYFHDAEGNRLSQTDTVTGAVTTYAYDHRNRLTGVTVKAAANGAVTGRATYTYDAFDRRIATTVDADGAGPNAPATTWTAYDGANPYADFDGSGSLRTRYLHGPAVDWLLARTDSAGTTAWYLTDRLGSVRDIADTAGTVINHVAYDAFGNVTAETNPENGDPFGFTGRVFDTATGLQYNWTRFYDAALGVWTQPDPIGFAAGDANLYRYVGNSPTNFIDPTGLASFWGTFDYVTDAVGSAANYAYESASYAYYTVANSDAIYRVGGALQAAGGAAEMTLGGGLIAAPEPTLTKVGGAALIVHGADNVVAGGKAMWYGRPSATVTATTLSAGLQYGGMSPEWAAWTAQTVDASIGIVGPAKAGQILSGRPMVCPPGRIQAPNTVNPGSYLAGKAPNEVTPGVRVLEGYYVDDLGRVQPWRAYYDEYGRQVARTDFNAGNKAQGIPDVHHHTYEYNARYPLGREAQAHIPGEYRP